MMKATIEWKTEKHLNKGMNSCTLPNKGPKKQNEQRYKQMDGKKNIWNNDRGIPRQIDKLMKRQQNDAQMTASRVHTEKKNVQYTIQ